MEKILEQYDATALIGLSIVLINSAKEIVEDGDEGPETYVEVPDMEGLMAAAAMARCLRPHKLGGSDIRAIRKIADMTARELSEAMGGNTATETISRWENEAEFPGGYVDKLMRLAFCERLKDRVTGVDYHPDKVLRLKVIGNGKVDPKSIPPLRFKRMPVQSQDRRVNDSWTDEMPKAA